MSNVFGGLAFMSEKLKLVVGYGVKGEETKVDHSDLEAMRKIKNAIENMGENQSLTITKVNE